MISLFPWNASQRRMLLIPLLEAPTNAFPTTRRNIQGKKERNSLEFSVCRDVESEKERKFKDTHNGLWAWEWRAGRVACSHLECVLCPNPSKSLVTKTKMRLGDGRQVGIIVACESSTSHPSMFKT